MDKRAVIAILVAVTILFIVASIIILPDSVVMQVGFDGKVNTYMPKAAAILLPTIISAIGIAMYWRATEGITFAYVIIAFAGFVVYAVILAISCL